MCRGLRNVFRLRRAAGRAGEGLYACFFAGRLFRHDAGIPSMVRSLFLITYGANALVLIGVLLRPCAPGMRRGFGNVLRLRCVTSGTGESLYARFLTGRLLRYRPGVPRMICGIRGIAYRTGPDMRIIIFLRPTTPRMVRGLRNRLCLRRAADGAGIGLGSFFLAGRLFRYRPGIPRMCLSIHRIADGAGTLMVVVVRL